MSIDDFGVPADALVSEKKQASYASLWQKLKKRDDHSVLDKGSKKPFSDGQERRAYKGHLALLDLPKEMQEGPCVLRRVGNASCRGTGRPPC